MEQVTSARGRERVDLDELFGRLEARATSETPGPQLAPREIVRPLPRRDVLGEFARDAQVNAILFDAEDSLALLNGELVRVGDVLPGGVQVSAIARRRVELTLGDEVRSVGLPALRTRPRAAESDEGPGAAPAPVTAAPEAAPQTPEPGPTAHED
ncbi:MAG: hypothetical protein H6828_00455 [Planctomycetes bacterium]|nr:hypothetical protein [Planctomycetota bacterium]